MSRKFLSFWLLLVPDLLWFYVSLFLAIRIRYPEGLEPSSFYSHVNSFSLIYFFWLIIFFIHGLYEISGLRRYTSLFFNLFSATVVNGLVAMSYFYLQPSLSLTPRRVLLLHLVLCFVLVLAWNLLVKILLRNKLNTGVYLFSFNRELGELEKEIQAHNYLGYSVLGHLNEQTLKQTNFTKDIKIILPDNLNAKPEVLAKFYELRKLGVEFSNHKDFYENLLRRIFLSELNEIWFLENVDYSKRRFYNLFKRFLDILFGLIGVVLFCITFPFIAILVKISSSGTIFFIQERVGKNGKLFKVYKYRTMRGEKTDTWTSLNDPRITKIGKFLRKSRIDECPQFFNILLGNMSLVGPRPEQPHLVEVLKKDIPFYDERHLVKPGLTGWAQLNIYAGSVEESKQKLQYDLYYIKNRGVLLDLEIILKTIYYIFTWRGR